MNLNVERVFTLVTGAALVGLVLYNAQAAATIMAQAGSSLSQYIGAINGRGKAV